MVSVTVFLATAATFWGSVAPAVPNQCPDGVRYTVVPPSELFDPLWSVAEVQQLIYGDGRVTSDCIIRFRQGWRRAVNGDEEACSVVIHEVGHAAYGMTHDSPYRVMSNDFADTGGHRWIPAICRTHKRLFHARVPTPDRAS